jgi:DNA-binding transcriptional LysR family regulator
VRKLATVRYVVCAASKYLSARGVPETPADLAHHDCLTYRRPRNGRIRQWRLKSGSTIEHIDIDGFMTFNSGETLVTAAAAGLGVIQVAEYYARPGLDAGGLVEVLAGYKVDAYDISVVFQKEKRATPRLRVFVDFLVKLFNPPPWNARRRG